MMYLLQQLDEAQLLEMFCTTLPFSARLAGAQVGRAPLSRALLSCSFPVCLACRKLKPAGAPSALGPRPSATARWA
jgi:hypothetical protein